jgi:hypothetical protein
MFAFSAVTTGILHKNGSARRFVMLQQLLRTAVTAKELLRTAKERLRTAKGRLRTAERRLRRNFRFWSFLPFVSRLRNPRCVAVFGANGPCATTVLVELNVLLLPGGNSDMNASVVGCGFGRPNLMAA